jgi:hypothetical protein
MKRISTALLAAGLVALSACSGAGEENAAANNVTDEAYNVAPDDLGDENLLGNDTLGNDVLTENEATTNTGADGNATENSSGY